MEKNKDKLLGTITFGSQLIDINIISDNSECAIFQTAQLLINAGCVEKSYPDAVWKREQSFPTGLQLKDICVAIPHAEAVHVKESAIALGILRNPVDFQLMGEPDRKGAVHLLVMLAIKDPNKQIDVLQNLMEVFQTEGAVQSILQADTCEEAATRFASLIQKSGK
ncbi:PTS sugar transporter subunit IIA [Intestinibacillus sp. NTUH-41-i26]|uniref:PTS sugar transporter subunit IIA n=1 Tax=Butyricicoccaceae TaxID=3085642 RepID=UPI000D1EC302|nr:MULTISPECIES: PTS sugar transporter subunit IIA [Butyricicoccaceae]WOC75935.1 PTS sugar transporter subunit IIA [Intestinibacillus sp. NTUH-41-i26]